MKDMNDPEDTNPAAELDITNQILEMILINSLRQTDFLAIMALKIDREEAVRAIEMHARGQLMGDIPYMSPPQQETK